MKLSENIVANRVTGTLELHLEDGRMATLEVDLDISDPSTGWGIDREYTERDGYWPLSNTPALPVATTYSIRIPSRLTDHDRPEFVLRIPVTP